MIKSKLDYYNTKILMKKEKKSYLNPVNNKLFY